MIDEDALVGSLLVGLAIGAASMVTRHGAEKSWAMVFNDDPPHKKADEDVRARDAILWAASLGAATGLVRLGIRRILKKKAVK